MNLDIKLGSRMPPKVGEAETGDRPKGTSGVAFLISLNLDAVEKTPAPLGYEEKL